jgi:transposase
MHDTSDRTPEVLRLHDLGEPANAIALKVGVPGYLVREIVRANGRGQRAGVKSRRSGFEDQIRELNSRGDGPSKIAGTIGEPIHTVHRWMREMGLATANPVDRVADEAVALYRDGHPVGEIAARYHVSERTVQRWAGEQGVQRKPPGGKPPAKRDRNLARVLELHGQGKDTEQIRQALDELVNRGTIEKWLRDSGVRPLYPTSFASHSTEDHRSQPGRPPHPRTKEAVERIARGEEPVAVAQDVGVTPSSLYRWLREAGSPARSSPDSPERVAEVVKMYGEGVGISEIAKRAHADFYTVRRLLAQGGVTAEGRFGEVLDDLRGQLCPCGGWTGSKSRSYHPECRDRYGKKREEDPANWTTTPCAAGDGDIRHRKSQPRKYHEECARTHLKSLPASESTGYINGVYHESSYEAAFVSACTLRKAVVRRYDRQADGEVAYDGHLYGPDFVVSTPEGDLPVEIKGEVKAHNLQQWAAFRQERGALAVADRGRLLEVSATPTRAAFVALLRSYADDPRGL